ncbi:hypothetical protein GCM10010342_75600 [Streptomyces anulatus]|nr:hypothetical protein GCM10010342_75600 [Streptomyces anulatus]
MKRVDGTGRTVEASEAVELTPRRLSVYGTALCESSNVRARVERSNKCRNPPPRSSPVPGVKPNAAAFRIRGLPAGPREVALLTSVFAE